MKKLPSPPQISCTENNLKILPKTGFLKIKRSELTFYYPDGSISKPCIVDRMFRKAEDSVGILAWFKLENVPYVYLRSAIRPSLALRDYSTTGLRESKNIGNLWELPAGGIEKEEIGYNGILIAAARETKEELGFDLTPDKFKFLGKRTFLDVGSSGTRMFLLHCEVDPNSKKNPETDGSPMEIGGEVIDLPLKEALTAINDGYIIDSYSEIGIRRLANFLDVVY